MRKLLNENERRKLQLAEILIREGDWVQLKDLTEEIACSNRILKYDLNFFHDHFTDFQIESSHHGVRLVFAHNKGLKNIYSNILDISNAFQLLEKIFFNETLSIDQLADELFISVSTLYRLIHHINNIISDYGFQIKNNPCHLVGDEAQIRYFYYQFFFEKYTILSWPYEEINTQSINDLINFFMNITGFQKSFAHYNIAKLLLFINLIRYQKKHYISNNDSTVNIDKLFSEIEITQSDITYFNNKFNFRFNDRFVVEVMSPFFTDNYAFNYQHLMKIKNNNQMIADEILAIDAMLLAIAKDNSLPLSQSNKETLILALYNAIHIENYDPRSGYILYDRNTLFRKSLQKYFPDFDQSIYNHLLNLLKQFVLSTNEKVMNYLIYILFVHWDDLLLELRKKIYKIKVLIISNRTASHSFMIKNFLDAEYGDYLVSQIYQDSVISTEILEMLDYDCIIANFPIPQLKNKDIFYIENFPSRTELSGIEQLIKDTYNKIYDPY